MKKSHLTLFLMLAALATPAAAQAPSLDARVNLSVADRPIEDVVATLRARSGANIVILEPAEPGEAGPIAERRITLDVSDVTWREALDIAAEAAGLVVEQRTGGILAVVQTERVSFVFDDQPIQDVIEAIATIGKANIVIAPEVTGQVSVRFNGVPWRTALEVVSKTRGYVVVADARDVLRVVDPSTLRDQLETRTYQLRYVRPQSVYKPQIKSEFLQAAQQQQQQGGGGARTTAEIAKTFTVLQALTKALSDAGKIDYIDSQNVVIVRDTPQIHESIEAMLGRIDVEPAQVFCDVKFVSTANGDVLNLGVDYGDGGPQIGFSMGQIPISLPFDLGDGGWDDSIIASPSGDGPFADPTPGLNGGNTLIPDTVFGSLSFTQWAATLRLLQRDTKTEVIQAPKLVTLDGREGTIFVGETIRYAEAKSEQGQAGGLQLSVAEASGSPVEVGFQLLVRPNIVPGTNRMMMEIIPKETSLSGTGSSALAPAGFDVFTIGASGLEGSIALPRTRSSTIVTTMLIESGQTAVIGGLSSDSDTVTHTKVPFLGDIPVLGELFKHRSKSRDRRSLLVFITPTIVRSNEDNEAILRQELDRRRTDLKAEMKRVLDVFGSDGRGTSD